MKIIVNTKILVYCALAGVVFLVAGIVLGFKVFPMIVNKKVWEVSCVKNKLCIFTLYMYIPATGVSAI